jgi:paraquat-inducible protein A
MAFQKALSDNNIWVASCLFFVAGILLPMFTFSKFIVFNDTFSLLGGIFHLLKEGEVFLFFVVFAFSIVGPTYKLKLIRELINKKDNNEERKLKSLKRLAIISKWSMADVFVIAVLVATVKLGMLASVSVHIGIVFFGVAVLLSMALVQRLMSDYEFRPKEPS